MRYSKLALFMVSWMVLACGPAETETIPTEAPTETSQAEDGLANTEWTLTSFGTAGEEPSLVEGTTITLIFESETRAGGFGGCNSYGGDYQAQDGKISFSDIVSTLKACLDENATQQEQRYFSALQSAGTFELADDQLTIFYDDGQSLVFERSESF
ncbi:MAG: META domain-containing protein [Acidobacteriota bacterium]